MLSHLHLQGSPSCPPLPLLFDAAQAGCNRGRAHLQVYALCQAS